MMMQQELLLADEGKREILFEFSTGILFNSNSLIQKSTQDMSKQHLPLLMVTLKARCSGFLKEIGLELLSAVIT